jgi:hypothetical protein
VATRIPVLDADGRIRTWLDTSAEGVVVLLAIPEDAPERSCEAGTYPPGPGDFVGFAAKFIRLHDGRYCRCSWAEGPQGRVVQGRLVTPREVGQEMVSQHVQPREDLIQECIRNEVQSVAQATEEPVLPPFPELTRNLFAIHYSQELPENSSAQTPPVSAIVIQHVLTQNQRIYAAFNHAEERGWTAQADFLAHLPELERLLLEGFYAFVREHPSAIYLNWGMRHPHFGFEVLAQRARIHKITPPEIPPRQRFDLDAYLKRLFGDNYVGHPRFFKAMAANGHNSPELLDKDGAAAAWAAGQHGRLQRSLGCKVDGIADMYDAVRQGSFKTRPEPSAPATTESGMTTAEYPSATAPPSRWQEARQTENPLPAPQAETPTAPDAPVTTDSRLPGGQAKPKKRRMTRAEADNKARMLAKKRKKRFLELPIREWAKAIGCSTGLVAKLPLWIETQARKQRQPRGQGKSPKTVSLTANLEAVTGHGDKDAAIRQLIKEQEADYEPSPLEDDPLDRPKTAVRARKRL